MTAQPDTTTAKPKRTNQPRVTPYFIRGVKATTMRNGKSVLELEVGTSNRHLVTFDDHEQLAVLETVGITVHDGGKFYLGAVPMAIDTVTPIDLNVEFTSYLGGRKITGATVNTLDAKPAGGLTDAQFFDMWRDACNHSPSLKVVESDPETWGTRVKGIIIRFYKAVYEGPESAEMGRLAGEWVIEQCQQTKSCGDERFIQNLLKRRLRADAPEGSDMATKAKTTPKEFDLEASQADIGLRIRDAAKARNFEINEEAILGKKAREFVTDEATYGDAIQIVAQHFGDLDAHMTEFDFLKRGIEANLQQTGLQDDAFAKDAVLKEALAPYGDRTTLGDVAEHKDYDRAVFLAAHLSACQAYLVKDKPKFENGTQAPAESKADDQADDFDVLHKLNNADAPMGSTAPVDNKTASPDETPAATKPAQQTEPPKKFSLEEATQWVDDEKKLYPELNAMKIMTILKISGWREWQQQGHTLKDASEAVKRYLQDKAAAAMVEEGKTILKDKGVPLEEWPKIVAEAGEPKLMWEPPHMRATWLEKVASNASAYVVKSLTVPDKPAAPPATTTAALVPAPQPTAILSALKLPSPGEMQVMFEFAKAIADSTLFPGVDTPARAIAIMLKSLQMGIGAVDGFENVYIIPSKKGDRLYPSTNLLRGRVMANPICRKFDVMGDETKAVAIVMRVGDEGPTTYTYTIEDARKAGALDTYDDGNIKKPLWKQIPKTMLQHRVARMALFAKFPDLAIGLVPEDLDEEEVA